VRNQLVVTAIVQTVSAVDNGLEFVDGWNNDKSYRATLVNAPEALQERAGARDVFVTHEMLLPRGVSVKPGANRILIGTDVCRIVQVFDDMWNVRLLLEHRDGDA
jgi:hypothetical protein